MFPGLLLLVIAIGGVNIKNVRAQDPLFSQFYAAPIYLNPALAGVSYGPRIGINYRNQWPALNRAYQTYALSYDQFFSYLNSGFGATLLTDKAGDGILTTNKVNLVYSYQLQLSSKWKTRLGMEFALVQSRLDWDKLLFSDQIDPVEGSISPGGTPFPTTEIPPEDFDIFYVDMGTGFIVYSDNIYIGAGFKHLNRPSTSFLNINENTSGGLPIQWMAHAGAEWSLWKSNKTIGEAFISPGILFVRQGPFNQLLVGSYAQVNIAKFGIWYRHTSDNPDAAIFALGVESGVFEITYSYDLTISGLGPRSGGSHEVSIGIKLGDEDQHSVISDCFNIFR